jgi:hypothetical protein
MIRSGIRLAGLAVALGAALPRRALPQADSAKTRSAAVTGVTLGTIYVGAGRQEGLREGSLLRVQRLGERGRYRVTYLASHSAAARGDSLAPLPAVGDTVVFVPVAEVATAAAGATSAPPGLTRRPVTLRGRIGVRFLGSWDRQSKVALRQPGFELMLDGPLSPRAPVGLDIEIRSRRSSVYRPGAATVNEGTMGVYQAAIRLQSPGAPFRAVLGRQYAPTLAGVGLFDGLLLDWQKPRWGAGMTAGLSPELGSLAFSSDLRQAGFFVQGRSSATNPLRWGLTLGGMGSYASGGINREFGFLQANLGSRHFSSLLLQELDVNRGWKRAAGEPAFSLTSTFLLLSLMPSRGVALSGGFDNRRNIRLYRDLITPEEQFDDRFRTGYWGGANFTLARKLRLGGELRTNTVSGADSLRTTAGSLTLSADQLGPLGLGFRARGTRYTTPGRGPGTVFAGGVRVSPARQGSLELNGGARRESAAPDSDRFWAGIDWEMFPHRGWFILGSFTREWGRHGLTPTTDIFYGGVSYRF